MYVVYPRMEGGSGIRLGRIQQEEAVEPYPNAAWSTPNSSDNRDTLEDQFAHTHLQAASSRQHRCPHGLFL
jgi:hypothetical protein